MAFITYTYLSDPSSPFQATIIKPFSGLPHSISRARSQHTFLLRIRTSLAYGNRLGNTWLSAGSSVKMRNALGLEDFTVQDSLVVVIMS